MVVVRGAFDGPETHEEWMLSCGGSLRAGGISALGSWCRTRDWGNQDGGSVTKWVFWFVFSPLALMLATERLPHSPETELSLDTDRLSLHQGPSHTMNLDEHSFVAC